jgi:sulfur-oxidizing protein SoxX
MRKTASAILGASALAMLMGTAMTSPWAYAEGGKLPDPKVCESKDNPPKDAVTKGACVIIDRVKGNCTACHMIPGADSWGDIAPPLVAMPKRFPDKNKLREQVSDPHKFNPDSIMPPFGKHEILTKEEIDNVVEFLYTL